MIVRREGEDHAALLRCRPGDGYAGIQVRWGVMFHVKHHPAEMWHGLGMPLSTVS